MSETPSLLAVAGRLSCASPSSGSSFWAVHSVWSGFCWRRPTPKPSNRYDAAAHIIAVDGAWRIRETEILDERWLL